MKHVYNLLRAMMLLLFFMVCAPMFSQIRLTSKTLDMDDLLNIVSLWNDDLDNDEFQHYIEKIIFITNSEIDEELYPYILSEMFFYRYFAPVNSSMPIFSELDKKADEIINNILILEKDSPEILVVHKLFDVVSSFYGNRDTFPSYKNSTYKKIWELPDAAEERKRLLIAIGDAEAMYARFTKLLASQTGNVALRFSGEAYTKTMNNPSLVYVIQNEPTFALLNDALSKSETMPDVTNLDEGAALYYSFIEEIKTAKELFAVWGVPVNSVLPEELSKLFILYDTDPFLFTCLDVDVIFEIQNIVSYLSNCGDLYISRINRLANLSGN